MIVDLEFSGYDESVYLIDDYGCVETQVKGKAIIRYGQTFPSSSTSLNVRQKIKIVFSSHLETIVLMSKST